MPSNLKPTTRIEAYSDAIFAIVLTLLVLDLHVPDLPQGSSPQAFLEALLPVSYSFVAFALSFLIVSIFLINHHNFFSTLENTDDHFLWHNNHVLFWICLMPFPTAFISMHPTDSVPIALYGLNLFFASVAFWLMTLHADKAELYKSHLQGEYSRKRVKRNAPALIFYGLSIPFAFINPLVSLAFFVTVPIFYFFPSRYKEFVVHVMSRKGRRERREKRRREEQQKTP
jgi:uncharacterized membrane protein